MKWAHEQMKHTVYIRCIVRLIVDRGLGNSVYRFSYERVLVRKLVTG